eukprot:scaffold35585_cov32-Tisochrysis_lutea.AAC.2
MAVAIEPQLSVTAAEDIAETEALLKHKMEELARLKEQRAKEEEAAAAAAAAAAKAAREEAEKKALPPGAVKTEAVPHWRTWVPACGILIASRESIGMTALETAFAVLCLVLTVFLAQQLLNRFENTEWRRNLRLLGQTRTAVPKEDLGKPKSKAASNPKKSKKIS